MSNVKLIFQFAFITIIALSSCGKDDPIIPNEEEVITSLSYSLTPTDGSAPVLLSFKDLDGDGGNAPEIIGGTLKANMTYEGNIELLNEQASPVESINLEIVEEAEDHQFFFQSNISSLIINYNDEDANGAPLGLSTNLATAGPASGTLTIILRHEPNKAGEGVDIGEIENAGGETDIQVTFNVDVE